jgi:hypothetical protein
MNSNATSTPQQQKKETSPQAEKRLQKITTAAQSNTQQTDSAILPENSSTPKA